MCYMKNSTPCIPLDASKCILHNPSVIYSLVRANYWLDIFHQAVLVQSIPWFFEGWFNSWLKTEVWYHSCKDKELCLTHKHWLAHWTKIWTAKMTFTGCGYPFMLVHKWWCITYNCLDNAWDVGDNCINKLLLCKNKKSNFYFSISSWYI